MGNKKSIVAWAADVPDCRDKFISEQRKEADNSPSNSWWKSDEEPSIDIGILKPDELDCLRHAAPPCAAFAVAAGALLCAKQMEPSAEPLSPLFIAKDATSTMSLREALHTLRHFGICRACNFEGDTPFGTQSPFVEAEAYNFPIVSYYRIALLSTDILFALSKGMPVVFALTYLGTDPKLIKVNGKMMRRAVEYTGRAGCPVHVTAVISGWCGKKNLFYGNWSSPSPDPHTAIAFTPSLLENVNQCADAWSISVSYPEQTEEDFASSDACSVASTVIETIDDRLRELRQRVRAASTFAEAVKDGGSTTDSRDVEDE